ncbi:hypothetical protein ACHAXT_013256 [Thalassiosira profunda]
MLVSVIDGAVSDPHEGGEEGCPLAMALKRSGIPQPPPGSGSPTPEPPASSSGASSPSSSAPSSPSRRSSLRRTAVDPRAALMGADANPPLAAAAANAPAAAVAKSAAVGGVSGASGAVNIPGAAVPPPTGPRVVARPPLNAYLRVPLIRGEDDAVVCPDPGRPGTTKKIEVGKMMAVEQKTEEEKEGAAGNTKLGGGADGKSSAIKPETSNDQTAEASEAKEKNKKEIPVPTITAVRGYDVDVPPTYAVPASYVRNVCLHYDEAMDGNCEYNIDEEDEAWWRENDEFGPESKARVVMPGEEGDGTKVEGDAGTYAAGEAGGKGVAPPEKARGKKGQFVKKTSSKDDANDDAMDVDVDSAASDASLPPAAPSPPKKSYTVEQVLLLNPRYLHSRHSTRGLLRKYNPKLPLHLLERMLDVLEKATGFESIVTLPEAERLLAAKIPELVAIFGPLSERERRILAEDEERSLRRRLPLTLTNQLDGAGGFVDALDELDATFPALAPPVTLPQVISQVYDHWVAKRSRLRKPLLRRYWPPTAPTDTNPHQVFRHRETEKRRLRKKRQNDIEAYRKMRQLKADFERVGGLCDLISRREGAGRAVVELGNEYFEERLRGWIDAAGAPRRSGRLTKRQVAAALAVPRYYDDGPVVTQRGRGGMKRKRAAPYPPLPHHHLAAGVSDPESRGPSPVPPPGVAPPAPPPVPSGLPPPGMAPLPLPKVVAGHDGGLPAPHFLQPLATRDLPRAESQGGEGPSFPSYVNGRPVHPPGGPFRHRPRLGRGGRIMVDRVPMAPPLPSASPRGSFVDLPPKPTVVTYGAPLPKHGHDIAPLGADGPNYTLASSPGKFGPGRSPPARRDGRIAPLEGRGTDAATAPKAPPARTLAEVLPRSGGEAAAGNPVARRIEAICARALAEDYQSLAEAAAVSAGVPSVALARGGARPASPGAAWQDDGDEVLVPIEDWMEAPGGERLYGKERFAIGGTLGRSTAASRLRKPLLRRYWPPTAPTDTNPHQVFRHRETEKRRLRKKRQNDVEAYRKMRRLKADFERVGGLCDLISRREAAGRAAVELGNEYFEERLRGWIDAAGAPRRSGRLTKRTVEAALAVPRYYDDGPIVTQRGRGGMKRKRAPYPPLPHHHPAAAGVSDPESRGPSPVPPPGGAPPAPPPVPSRLPPPGMAPLLPPKVVAGHDGGLPAPHFLQPLATRELPRAEGRLDGEGPSFPSYVNGRPIHPPGGPFRHRPRLGRGGRIVVDRVPIASALPSASPRGSFLDLPPKPTVVTYGTPMNKHGHDIAPLGADGPNYTLAASPGKFGPGRSPPARRDGRLAPLEGGRGTAAATAPKAPPARTLAEVLPRSVDAAAGNPVARRIEAICARGLAEDWRASAAGAAASASGAPHATLARGGASPASPGAALGDDMMDEVLVPIEDWMEAPSKERLYGTERFAIGPL